MTPVHVAVIIVSFRSVNDVAGVLDALSRQTYRNISVVICENGGADAWNALQAMVGDGDRGDLSVALVRADDNPGYAGGINRAMARCPDAGAWWILNPDTVPAEEALQHMVDRLARADVAAVGGMICDERGTAQSIGGRWRPWAARCVSLAKGLTAAEARDRATGALDYISGASMLVGRAMVDTVGLMREDYFLYCEEVEWCLRARRAGLRFGIAPDARVTHRQGASTGSGAAARARPRLPIYLDERNKLHVVRDTRTAHLAVAAPVALLLLTIRYLKAGAWRQWGDALAGWRAGLAGERGKPAWFR